MQESQYSILQVIGQGSYGKVYKAIHRQSGTPVAIKVLACSEQSNEKVANELQIMMDCNNEHVIRCFGCQIAPSGVWIVMEYCQHGSVADLLRKSVRLSQFDIASIIQSIIRGLDYLHSKKKIHRDVKAANVLLDQKGVAKLADFGVAAELLHTFADKETIIGSPFWMSPEILSKCKYNFKTDIWSLGITAIQLAEGQPPFSNLHPFRAMFQIKQTPPKGLSSPELYSAQFNNFVRKCLTYNPDQRPSARQLLSDPFIKLKSRGRLSPDVLQRARITSKIKQSIKEDFVKNDSGTIIEHISGDFSQGEIVWDKPDAGTIVLKDQIPLKQQQPDFINQAKALLQVEVEPAHPQYLSRTGVSLRSGGQTGRSQQADGGLDQPGQREVQVTHQRDPEPTRAVSVAKKNLEQAKVWAESSIKTQKMNFLLLFEHLLSNLTQFKPTSRSVQQILLTQHPFSPEEKSFLLYLRGLEQYYGYVSGQESVKFVDPDISAAWNYFSQCVQEFGRRQCRRMRILMFEYGLSPLQKNAQWRRVMELQLQICVIQNDMGCKLRQLNKQLKDFQYSSAFQTFYWKQEKFRKGLFWNTTLEIALNHSQIFLARNFQDFLIEENFYAQTQLMSSFKQKSYINPSLPEEYLEHLAIGHFKGELGYIYDRQHAVQILQVLKQADYHSVQLDVLQAIRLFQQQNYRQSLTFLQNVENSSPKSWIYQALIYCKGLGGIPKNTKKATTLLKMALQYNMSDVNLVYSWLYFQQNINLLDLEMTQILTNIRQYSRNNFFSMLNYIWLCQWLIDCPSIDKQYRRIINFGKFWNTLLNGVKRGINSQAWPNVYMKSLQLSFWGSFNFKANNLYFLLYKNVTLNSRYGGAERVYGFEQEGGGRVEWERERAIELHLQECLGSGNSFCIWLQIKLNKTQNQSVLLRKLESLANYQSSFLYVKQAILNLSYLYWASNLTKVQTLLSKVLGEFEASLLEGEWLLAWEGLAACLAVGAVAVCAHLRRLRNIELLQQQQSNWVQQ